MTEKKKQEVRFTLIPTIEILDDESRSSLSRSVSPLEQPTVTQEECLVESKRAPKLLSCTPPDTLMYPLFSAIQRKAWSRAKKLCYELMLCDPERKSYRELYVRIDQITKLIDQQRHPQPTINSAITASTDGENPNRQ